MPLLSVYLLRSTGGVLINKHCCKYQNSFLAASVSKFMRFKQWFAHPHVAVCPQKLDCVLLGSLGNRVLKTLISGGGK